MSLAYRTNPTELPAERAPAWLDPLWHDGAPGDTPAAGRAPRPPRDLWPRPLRRLTAAEWELYWVILAQARRVQETGHFEGRLPSDGCLIRRAGLAGQPPMNALLAGLARLHDGGLLDQIGHLPRRRALLVPLPDLAAGPLDLAEDAYDPGAWSGPVALRQMG
jgi:hypothetical protein